MVRDGTTVFSQSLGASSAQNASVTTQYNWASGNLLMKALWTFVTQDWYFFWPMFLMSLAGMTLVIWRLLPNVKHPNVSFHFTPKGSSWINQIET